EAAPRAAADTRSFRRFRNIKSPAVRREAHRPPQKLPFALSRPQRQSTTREGPAIRNGKRNAGGPRRAPHLKAVSIGFCGKNKKRRHEGRRLLNLVAVRPLKSRSELPPQLELVEDLVDPEALQPAQRLVQALEGAGIQPADLVDRLQVAVV